MYTVVKVLSIPAVETNCILSHKEQHNINSTSLQQSKLVVDKGVDCCFGLKLFLPYVANRTL